MANKDMERMSEAHKKLNSGNISNSFIVKVIEWFCVICGTGLFFLTLKYFL